MQDLDLLDKSGVRQHFRFVANRYDVAKAPWEDIVDTLSEMLPSYIELYNCMGKFVEAFNHQEYASHFRMTPEWGDIIKVSHQSNRLSMASLKLFSPDARKLKNTMYFREVINGGCVTHKPDMSKVTELFAYLMEHFLDDVDRVMGQLEKELQDFEGRGLYVSYFS